MPGGWACRPPRSPRSGPATWPGWSRRLAERVVDALAGAEPPAATRLRHRELLDARPPSAPARRRSAEDEALELAAEDVRLAARALDRITGRIDPEEVLGRIFATFCIGK